MNSKNLIIDDDEVCISWTVLYTKYSEWLDNSYLQTTSITKRKNLLIRLNQYMHNNNISLYTSEVGNSFLDISIKDSHTQRYKTSLIRFIYELNCIATNKVILLRILKVRYSVSKAYEVAFNGFLEYCKKRGNKELTIRVRMQEAKHFFDNLEFCGCSSLEELTPEIVLRASLIRFNCTSWLVYRLVLRYLAEEKFVCTDYSPLIPTEKVKRHLPDVYSKEEILALESAFNRNTSLGKRNYAIILLASRLMLRKCDIIKMCLSNIDFQKDEISIFQEKTTHPLSLPLLPEVKEAIQDYIYNARPQTDEPFIFIRSRYPFRALSPQGIYGIFHKGFELAGVACSDKESGSRSIRSSGSSHMINGGIPYPVVRKTLGHNDKNAISHYARLDIAQLRKCALDVPKITENSFFQRFLEGKETL